jgi:hypothetical protein
VSQPYDYEGLFLKIGGGLLIAAIFGYFANIGTFADVLCAAFAAYVVLRITNAMRRADTRPPRQ